jgi:hypothetical protein
MNIDTENIDIKRDMYIEEAKFWGLQQYNWALYVLFFYLVKLSEENFHFLLTTY